MDATRQFTFIKQAVKQQIRGLYSFIIWGRPKSGRKEASIPVGSAWRLGQQCQLLTSWLDLGSD